MDDVSEPKVIALVRDLMFMSKISATARALGVQIRTIRDAKALADAAGQVLLVDLNLPEAIPAAATWRGISSDRKVIGFVSHVDGGTIALAREAGIDQVLARSAFTLQLSTILRDPHTNSPSSK